MFMLRSTHEKIIEELEEKHSQQWHGLCIAKYKWFRDGADGARKGLLRLQRRYKKLQNENQNLKRIVDVQNRHIKWCMETYSLETVPSLSVPGAVEFVVKQAQSNASVA